MNAQELAAKVGENIGTSEWAEMSQERINQFAEATGDHQFIHVNEEMAKMTPFGGTIAHGFLTLSMIPYLGAQGGDRRFALGADLGMQHDDASAAHALRRRSQGPAVVAIGGADHHPVFELSRMSAGQQVSRRKTSVGPVT